MIRPCVVVHAPRSRGLILDRFFLFLFNLSWFFVGVRGFSRAARQHMLWPGENGPTTRSKSKPCSIACELPFETYISMRWVAQVSLPSLILKILYASTVCRLVLGLLDLNTTCRDEFRCRSSQECRCRVLDVDRSQAVFAREEHFSSICLLGRR